MKDSIRARLEKMTDRFEEVGRLLAAPEVAGSSQQFRDLSVEYSRLQPLAERFGAFRALEADLAAAREMSTDPDAGMRSLGEEEVVRVEARLAGEEVELASLLIPFAVIVFVIKHWEATKKPFLRTLACLPIYAIGFALAAYGAISAAPPTP